MLGKRHRGFKLVGVVAALVTVWLPLDASAQNGVSTTTTTVIGPTGAVTTTVTTSTVAAPVSPLLSFAGRTGTVAFIFLILLMAFILAIYFFDLLTSRYPMRHLSLEALTKDQQFELAKLRAGGTSGLVRVLIALGLLLVLLLLLAALVGSAAQDAPDLRKTVITGLLASFTTVVGFYFGSGGTSKPPDDKKKPDDK
jgi:hypothetical protein